jgi:hypothetical protein
MAVSPPLTERGVTEQDEDANIVKKNTKRSGGYESVDMRDEYEGEGYEGHPLRVRSVLES